MSILSHQNFFEPQKTTTPPETNSSPLKMDGWNTSFLLGRPIFRGYVSFRECILLGQKITPYYYEPLVSLNKAGY